MNSPKDAEIALKAVENISAESAEIADTTTASETSITNTTTPTISQSLTQEFLSPTRVYTKQRMIMFLPQLLLSWIFLLLLLIS